MTAVEDAEPTQAEAAEGPPETVAPSRSMRAAASGYLRRTFVSFTLRDFRLLLAGNVITMFGTWFQNIGMNWLVWKVTGNPFAMGTLQAWRGFIALFLLPFGGVWADRFERRRLLIAFTAISASEATALAFLVYTNLIAPGSGFVDRLIEGTPLEFLSSSGMTKAWVFFLFALVDGLILSMMAPIRQAFVYDVTGREHVANAIALNAGTGNLARALGPNLAGAVIGYLGAHWAFIVRAGAIWAALQFTIRIRPKPREAAVRAGPTWRAFTEGLRYVRGDRVILGLIAVEVLLPFLIYPYIQFLPVFAEDVLHGDARVYGALASGVGIGAIPGGVLLASLGDFRHKGRLLLACGFAYLGSVFLFTRSTLFPLSWAILIMAGFFWVMTTSLIQAVIQLNVRPDVRARTVAIYTMGNYALQPLGALSMGAVVAAVGPQNGVGAFALTAASALLVIAVLVPQIRRA